MSTAAHRIRLLMELRANGITDARVLGAIEQTPREAFTPPALRDRAYEDTALPIDHGQTLSQPTVVGLMTQALDVGPRMKVLEIGTGSGYQAAILARLCRRVYTIERHRALLQVAEERFRTLKLHNIVTRHGDGWLGWPELAPFERIMVTAAPEEVPQALLDQLAPDGILVIPVGPAGNQMLVRIVRTATGFSQEPVSAVRFVPLVHGLPQTAVGQG
jgi:protein-L-isoaspartate(D-aspartate) O-methyltransferase